MKVTKATILIFFVSLLFFSCENEPLEGTFTDEIGTGGSSGSGGSSDGFFANVDGTEFEEIAVIGVEAFGMLSVSGTTATGSSIAITVPSDVTTGTYTIDATTYRGQYNDASASPVVSTAADTGTINITAHDTAARTISGTFSFVATPVGTDSPQYTISEGSFSASY